MKRLKTLLIVSLALCFAGVILYSADQIQGIQADYDEEAEVHALLMRFSPNYVQQPAKTHEAEHEAGHTLTTEQTADADEAIVNQSVADLQKEYLCAIGWLTVPNTKIDYPFAQYCDNSHYLYYDINGKKAAAGTIFVDCRCGKNFTSQNTILYGHHMKNGSMFGTLKYFGNKAFFDENRYATICLANATLTLEFFAYMIVNPDTEREIFNVELNDTYFDYVRQNARRYRDVGLTGGDMVVTLSTCAYEFDDARMALLARVILSVN